MKQLIYILSLLWLMVSGCEPIEDFNHNPNNVSETHPQYLLTNIPGQCHTSATLAAGADQAEIEGD
ncbi:MAG: hypothetical protein GXY94_12075 [Bacteroidales bacterium]|jgi:hypothetical protein|nr:hypothetical protein [Bacteroidales bacterium]